MRVETPYVEALRYLEPERVEIAGDSCEGMTVKTATGRSFGRLDGFVVDPPARRVRYFVVTPPGAHGLTQLIPATAARVDMSDRAIEVIDESSTATSPSFSTAAFPRFSDEDLLAALFRRGARERP